MNGGWIKVFRQLKAWEWYDCEGMVHLLIHCVLSANFEDGQWQGHTIKRGQFVSSPRKIALETGMSYQTVRTCQKRLEKTGELTIKTTNKFSLYEVTGYDSYQSTESPNEQANKLANDQVTINQRSTNNQLTTSKKNKESKEEKEEEEIKNKGFAEYFKFVESDELKIVWNEFLEMRKKSKTKFTDYAKCLNAKKVFDMSAGKKDLAKKIIEQTIEKSYSSFFPLNIQKNGAIKQKLTTSSTRLDGLGD